MTLDNIERFESLLSSVKRDGVDKLLNYIRTTTFYTDPASSRYHSSYGGGLLQHSLNVYDLLSTKLKNGVWSNMEISDDTIILVSLLHDMCKTGTYQIEMRNKKENGKWVQVPFYVVKDSLPYGHGEKSVFIIDSFIRLTREEKFAIRWHMGFTEPKEMWNSLGEAMSIFPLIIALHESDIEATYILEKENTQNE